MRVIPHKCELYTLVSRKIYLHNLMPTSLTSFSLLKQFRGNINAFYGEFHFISGSSSNIHYQSQLCYGCRMLLLRFISPIRNVKATN